MVRKLIFILILLIPLALAVKNTDITIVTSPDKELTVNVLNADTSDLIESLVINISDGGRYTVNLSSDIDEIALYVIVRDNGKIVDSENYGNYTTGNSIYIDMNQPVLIPTPAVEENVTNITEINVTNETTPVLEENLTENVTGTGITGFSILKSVKIPKIVYYVFGAVILVAILGFVAMKIIPKIKIPERIIVRKQSEIQVSSAEKERLEKEYTEAERKLKEAKAEINKITNRDKIKEAERKLEADRAELEKLRKGF